MRSRASEDRLPAVFDADAFGSDVGRYRARSPARQAAEQAKRDFERHGVSRALLLACQAEGRDGTRLAGAYKAYLPVTAQDRPFGMVFLPVVRDRGALALVYLAFGVRHQPAGSRAPTVYALAHRRRHGPQP